MTAYASSRSDVVDAWDAYEEATRLNREARVAVMDRFGGRGLMVRRSGFGHSSRVEGFEQLDGDTDATLPPELRLNKVTGMVTPNLRRKAGKDLRDELAALTHDGVDLPGMPPFVWSGLAVQAPAIFAHDRSVWVRWSEETQHERVADSLGTERTHTLDELWTQVTTSEWWAAKEALDAEREQVGS